MPSAGYREGQRDARPGRRRRSDRAVINWRQDLVTTEGQRLLFDQLSFQLWKDGKIVHERFVYDPSTLSTA